MHRVQVIVLTTLLLLLASGSASQAATGGAPLEPESAFVPGQVLVRLNADAVKAPEAMTSAVERHGARTLRRVTDAILVASAPAGREQELVKRLMADPAVRYASLNYRLVATPMEVEPWSEEVTGWAAAPAQEVESCITDVWMSTAQQGERMLGNMVPSGTAQVHVFFEFTECQLEPVRVQVFYFDPDGPPVQIFNVEGFIISGSGIQGIQVPAWPAFEAGILPIGRYVTLVSLSPEGGWDEVANVPWRVSTFPNDPYFRGASNYQWPLHSTGRSSALEADIDAPQAWDVTTGSEQLLIAILSTGIAIDHPDLEHKIWTNRREIPDNGEDDDENGCPDDVHGCAFLDGAATPDPMDRIGWGTLSGGIAAAHTNNQIGVAGVAWGPRLLPVKYIGVLPDGRLAAQLADLIAGIDYAVKSGARIIHVGPPIIEVNVPPETLELLRSAIDDAVGQGVLVVAGSGDEDDEEVLYPARFENVVAVGASNSQGEVAWFSNSGPEVELVAPGELILAPYRSDRYPQQDYGRGSGTSLAAAHVDGVAALIWSVDPTLSPAEVRTILQESTRAPARQRHSNQLGFGLLNAANAVSQTTHQLWLKTDYIDELSLLFMVDDTATQVCKPVWNLGSTPLTWRIEASTPWTTVVKRTAEPVAPVPSQIVVCVDRGALPGSGIFETEIVARSNLARKGDPVAIPVTVVNQSPLSRVSLPLVSVSPQDTE